MFLCAQDSWEESALCTHNVSTSLLIIVLTSGKISAQIAFPLGKSEKPTAANMKFTVMFNGKYTTVADFQIYTQTWSLH